MNQYSAYSLVSMLNGNNNNNSGNTTQSGYPYSNTQPPGYIIPPYNRSSPSQQSSYSDKKGLYFDYGNKNRPYNGWGQKTDPELNVDEVIADHSFTVLDHYNCDLNIIIDTDGYGAYPLTDPEGFCFCWAGARSTYGVTRGKVFFEVHIIENLPVVYGDNHQEVDPHVVRLGWSIDSSCFQLGESENSYGYGGTGKFSVALKFSDYGERFGAGDVIGSLLDLQSHPPTISFTKNGHWFGTAHTLHNYPVGVKSKALFPHILTKNCRFKVNFGQTDAWFAPPPGFVYIDHVPLDDRVRGLTAPSKKADCEMNMIVGLPGAGKTTFGIKKQKDNAEKRYNIIGTDTLIDKMRVMGLPRKRNYHGRWDVLINKASKCLNKLFQIASRRKRNYILDQTNVYASARRNKMKHFQGFQRTAWVLVPEHEEFERRSVKRTVEDGKIVPVEAVLEMKANFKLPVDGVDPFDKIEFVELKRDTASVLVDGYVKEGIEKRPPREVVFRHDKYQQHPKPSPACSPQAAQCKMPDNMAAAMAAVRAAINYPAIKIEPGTVKIEPGLLSAPAMTSKPDLYPPHAAAAVSTPAVAATVVKTEPVSPNTADVRMETDSSRMGKESSKVNSKPSSSAVDEKKDSREDNRRRDRRDDRRHRSRSRSRSHSRSRSRSSSHYSDRSRHDRHRSERGSRDRHRSDRDRYRDRDRDHDRDRHRDHHRSDSRGRRRDSDGKSRDLKADRDGSYHSDSNSRLSDNRYSDSRSRDPKESTPNVKPPSPSNRQFPQKPADGGSRQSNWPQSGFTGQQCPNDGSDFSSKDIDRRQIASPFDAVGSQDKSNFSELFGSRDIDYRMSARSDEVSNNASSSRVSSSNAANYEPWQSQNRSAGSGPYGQSQQPGFSNTSQQVSYSRQAPPSQPQMPFPGPSYPQHNQGYYEAKAPNNFNNNPAYQNYPSPYPERNDRNRFSTNSSYTYGDRSMSYGDRSIPAPEGNRTYPPEKEESKNLNQNYLSAMSNQNKNSENRYAYPPSGGEMEKRNFDTRTDYSPLKNSVASHLANTQPTTSLYPPYTLNKPTNRSSEVVATNFPSTKDSDLRYETIARNETKALVPNKDTNPDSVSGMNSFSSLPGHIAAPNGSGYVSDGPSATKSFAQSANIRMPENYQQDSYPYGMQGGSVDPSQRWGFRDKGQDGRSSSYPHADIRDIPASAHPGQWSERSSMNPGMPPPPQPRQDGPVPAPAAQYGMRFPPNYPGYSGYPNMPPDMGRRYPY